MTTLYSGGLVFDGKGNLQENKGVLVDGQKISKVAPCGEFDGFSGDKVDTSGGTLLPGLIDCHVHLVYSGEADPKSRLLLRLLFRPRSRCYKRLLMEEIWYAKILATL